MNREQDDDDTPERFTDDAERPTPTDRGLYRRDPFEPLTWREILDRDSL